MIRYYLGGIPIWMGTFWSGEYWKSNPSVAWRMLMFYLSMSLWSTRDRWEQRRFYRGRKG